MRLRRLGSAERIKKKEAKPTTHTKEALSQQQKGKGVRDRPTLLGFGEQREDLEKKETQGDRDRIWARTRQPGLPPRPGEKTHFLSRRRSTSNKARGEDAATGVRARQNSHRRRTSKPVETCSLSAKSRDSGDWRVKKKSSTRREPEGFAA